MAEDDAGEEERGRSIRKRRKGRRRMAAVIALVIIIIPLLYFFVIPRTEVNVRVAYNEAMLNQINIDPELGNVGTNEVSDVTLRIAVVNSTDFEMGKKEYSVDDVAPVMGIAKLDPLTFRGNQYERYTVVVDLAFTAGGTTYTRHWSHDTQEPYMNLDWTDKVA